MELLTKDCRATTIIDKEHHRETTAGSVNSYFEISNLLVLVRFAVAFFMPEILNDADHCNDNADYSDSNSDYLQRDQARLLHTRISRMYHLLKVPEVPIHHWCVGSNIQLLFTYFP